MGLEDVVERRRAEREALLAVARQYAADLRGGLGVRAATVVGSVARGDFNRWSDTDLLVVADGFAGRSLLERLDLLAPRPAGVEPHPWTPEEWRRRLRRQDPMAVEAVAAGVWLVGAPAVLDQ